MWQVLRLVPIARDNLKFVVLYPAFRPDGLVMEHVVNMHDPKSRLPVGTLEPIEQSSVWATQRLATPPTEFLRADDG